MHLQKSVVSYSVANEINSSTLLGPSCQKHLLGGSIMGITKEVTLTINVNPHKAYSLGLWCPLNSTCS